MSEVLELEPMRAIHPVVELHDFLELFGGEVDIVFNVLRGMPKPVGNPPKPPRNDWVSGECEPKLQRARECVVDETGEETCSTPMVFGGMPSVRVYNLSCGWAPDMRFDRIVA